MNKLDELEKKLNAAIEADEAEKSRQDKIAREKQIKALIIIFSSVGIIIGISLFISWVSQFSGTEICVGIFIILIVVGLLGKLFE